MTTIGVESILASRNIADPNLQRVLHTVKARYPLWIHQELMTHRAFSRNTASSRAIPIKKMIWEAEEDPAMPLYWTRNQPGMQGYEFLTALEAAEAVSEWKFARDDAVKHARKLADMGLHKQVANRLLGPYIHTTAVVSATEWSNFFGVRIDMMTEPHMRDLAKAFYAATSEATVQPLKPGEWHLPFITREDTDWANTIYGNPEFGGGMADLLMPLSVARCASVSFKTVENLDMTAAKAQALYDKLITSRPLHASPAEHQGQADDVKFVRKHEQSHRSELIWLHPKDHRNFVGFRQWRAQLPNDTQ